MGKNLDEFLAFYNGHGEHPVTEIDLPGTYTGKNDSPFIIVRSGPYTMIINPMSFDDHLSVDHHSFVNGEDATAGAFGFSEHHRKVQFADTGTTSHGWPSAGTIAVLLGEQNEGNPSS
jgi:hypothetical protein